MEALPMVSADCSLDEVGMEAQRERYRVVGEGAEILERGRRRVVISVSERVRAAMIEELVEVERACCPFFGLNWEPGQRRLAVSVSRLQDEPALATIADALGV